MLDEQGYDAVTGGQRLRRWRSPYYWVTPLVCAGAAFALIATVGGAWFMIPLVAWPVAGYLVDRRLTASATDAE